MPVLYKPPSLLYFVIASQTKVSLNCQVLLLPSLLTFPPQNVCLLKCGPTNATYVKTLTYGLCSNLPSTLLIFPDLLGWLGPGPYQP